MRSGKLFVRILSMTLCALLAISCVACGGSSDDIYTNIFGDIDGEAGAEKAYDLFALVIPADSSPRLYDKASKLAKQILIRTQTEAKVYYDHQTLPEKDKMCTLLIGNTSYAEGKEFLHGFSMKDFAYGRTENYIVIGGVGESATIEAIDKFSSDVLAYSTPDLFVGESFAYSHRPSAEGEQYAVNGFPIYEYSIVYAAGNSYLERLAKEMQTEIATITDFKIGVYAESEIHEDARSICLGRTERAGNTDTHVSAGEAIVFSYSTGVSLLSDCEFGMKLACEEFLRLLSEEKKIDAQDARSYLFGASEVSVTQLDFSADSLSIQDVDSICRYLSPLQYDIIKLCGLDEKYVMDISESLKAQYALVSDEGTYYLARKAKLTLTGRSAYTKEDIAARKNVFTLKDINAKLSLVSYSCAEDASEADIRSFAGTLKADDRMIFFCDASGTSIGKLVNFSESLSAIRANICATECIVTLLRTQVSTQTYLSDTSYRFMIYAR